MGKQTMFTKHLYVLTYHTYRVILEQLHPLKIG